MHVYISHLYNLKKILNVVFNKLIRCGRYNVVNNNKPIAYSVNHYGTVNLFCITYNLLYALDHIGSLAPEPKWLWPPLYAGGTPSGRDK